MSFYLEDVDDSDSRTNHFQLDGNEKHHDSNMEEADSNVCEHLDDSMTRAWAEQLHNALTSQISATEDSMSLEACKLNGDGSNMFIAHVRHHDNHPSRLR